MTGMAADTGKALADIDHLYQSIARILTTPIGTRAMRREFGSRHHDLIDQPIIGSSIIDLYACIAEALDEWEPRFKLSKINVIDGEAGHVTVDLTGTYLPLSQEITLEGIVVV